MQRAVLPAPPLHVRLGADVRGRGKVRPLSVPHPPLLHPPVSIHWLVPCHQSEATELHRRVPKVTFECLQPGALRGGAFPGFTGRAELDSLSRALPQLPLPNLYWWSCCPQDPGRPQGYGSPPDQLGEQGQGPQPIGEGRRDPPGDLGRGHGCLSVPGGLLCPHPHAGPRQLGAAVQQRCPLPAHSPACPRAAPLGPSSWVQQPRPPALSSG